ncbi:MAG: Nudix family hydrolase [Gammaproteobacteria bacterium]|nr:Nudix family hydrolase [Gammaproteobacteria bacterium]
MPLSSTTIHVAVAVIQDALGRILLTRRPEHVHQGGLWEFPGGKVESGETLYQALKREICEELGIDVSAHYPLIKVKHAYPDRTVLLDVHRISAWSGLPEGLEGQPLAWVSLDDISHYPLPEADRPIVSALSLPDQYLITGGDPCHREQFLARLERSLEPQIKLVQLRTPDLPEGEYLELAASCVALCHRHNARLLLNADPDRVDQVGADGVHLNSFRLQSLGRRPLERGKLVAASCHNQSELEKAAALALDFALLSPVLPTASHPEAVPLGWPSFQQLVSEVNFPVYALGGMSPKTLAQARENGGQGIAAIRGLWSA